MSPVEIGIFVFIGFILLRIQLAGAYRAGFFEGMYRCLIRQGRSPEAAKAYIEEFLTNLREQHNKKGE